MAFSTGSSVGFYVGTPFLWLACIRNLLLAIASCFFLSISAAEHLAVVWDEIKTAKQQKQKFCYVSVQCNWQMWIFKGVNHMTLLKHTANKYIRGQPTEDPIKYKQIIYPKLKITYLTHLHGWLSTMEHKKNIIFPLLFSKWWLAAVKAHQQISPKQFIVHNIGSRFSLGTNFHY